MNKRLTVKGVIDQRYGKDVRNIRCDTCRRKYLQQSDFCQDHIDHMCLYRCRSCKIYLPTKKRLQKHKCKLPHKRTRTAYECFICHTIFKQKTTLKCHYGIHTRNYRYRCIRHNCHAFFDDHDAYRYHTQTLHDPSKKYRFECYVCRLKVRSKNELRLHAKVHEPKKRCRFCQRSYKRAVNNHVCKFFVEELQKISVLGFDQKPYKYKLEIRSKPVRDRF